MTVAQGSVLVCLPWEALASCHRGCNTLNPKPEEPCARVYGLGSRLYTPYGVTGSRPIREVDLSKKKLRKHSAKSHGLSSSHEISPSPSHRTSSRVVKHNHGSLTAGAARRIVGTTAATACIHHAGAGDADLLARKRAHKR